MSDEATKARGGNAKRSRQKQQPASPPETALPPPLQVEIAVVDAAPIVHCESQGHGPEEVWLFNCHQCGTGRQSAWHKHPRGPGHVAAACTNPASSYIATGYRIELAPGGRNLEGGR